MQARNEYGFSDYSNEVSILSAIAPEKPATPTTTVAGDTVIIQWTEPFWNGSPIEAYRTTI